jgi:hypothetical protein
MGHSSHLSDPAWGFSRFWKPSALRSTCFQTLTVGPENAPSGLGFSGVSPVGGSHPSSALPPSGRQGISLSRPGAATQAGIRSRARQFPASPGPAPEVTTNSYDFGLISLDRPLNPLYDRFNAERKEVVQNHMSIGSRSKREVAES